MVFCLPLALAISAGPQSTLAEETAAGLELALPHDAARGQARRGGEAGEGSRAWSSGDVALEMLFVVGIVADWNQTRHTIAAHRKVPGKPGYHYDEINPLLGRSPSRRQVDTYFLGATVAHVAVAHLLPGRWRTSWQLLGLGVEVGVVGRNLSMGIGFRF